MFDPESIFHEARKLSGEAREAYLKGACGPDLALRHKIDMLLKADHEAGSFLATSQGGDDDATLAQAIPSESAGQRIDRYKLLQQIGEGGFGAVWLAEQREPVRRKVALKIIKLGMDTKQVIARFEAERQALAMMDHPNIAKVLDAGATESGRPYFVMELVKGIPILEFCDSEKLNTKERLDLFVQVCHAIQHAHQKGIIHRDIKPSNVLVTLHDGDPVVKVIDFGIAKATSTELTQKTLFTEHRQMIGTPAYMSPEQAAMSGLDIDTRSDVYSLGVLLYELLTGTTPFNQQELLSQGFVEMMRIIREVEPHKPSTRLSSLGETGTRTAELRRADVKRLGLLLRGDLDWIVMKCLEKERGRRYETANGLAADIQRHLTGDAVLAAPPSRAYRMKKFVRRNRTAVLTTSVIAVLLVIGMIGTSWGMYQAHVAKESEAAQRVAAQESEERAVRAAALAEEERTRAERASALAQEEARTSQAITDFTLNLLGLANPDVSRSPSMTVSELLDIAGAEVGPMLAGQPRAELSMRTSIAHAYHVMGDNEAALEHVDRVMELLDVIPALTPIDRYEPLLVNLFVQVDLGETWGDALQQFWDNLEVAIIEMMPSIEEPLLEMRRVAGDRSARDEALATLAQINEMMESIPVEEEALRLYIVNYVHASGSRWVSRLYWQTAIEYLEWSVPAYQSTSFATHSYAARAVLLLAEGYQRTGEPEKAIALLREQADRLADVLPDGHPMVQHILLVLGKSLVGVERYEEAELVILPAAEQLRRDFDSVNPNHTIALRELIEFFEQSGQEHRIGSLRDELAIACAEHIRSRSISSSRASFGPEYQPFYEVLVELSRIFFFDSVPGPEVVERLIKTRQHVPAKSPQGAIAADLILRYANRIPSDQPELAEPMYREVLAILRVNQYAHPAKYGRTLRLYGQTLRRVDRWEEAAEFAKKAIPILAQWHGTHDYRTLEAHRLRGNCLADLERYAEAEQHLLASYEGRMEDFGPAHSGAVNSLLDLIYLYTRWHGSEFTDAFIVQHVPVHLAESDLSANSLRNVAREIVRFPEYSKQSYEIALTAAERALDVEPEDHDAGWSAIGRAQYRLGEYEQAVASLSRAVDNGVPGLFFDSGFLAMAQYRLGDKANARKNLQQFRHDVLERDSSPFIQGFIDEVEQAIGYLVPQE